MKAPKQDLYHHTGEIVFLKSGLWINKELVYKIGGADKDIAIISLKVLALLSSTSSATFDLISERYRGLSFILQKWSKESMDNSMFKFVTTLLERVKVSDEEYKLYKAAAVIQSTWRGHTTRMKLIRMKRGITSVFIDKERLRNRSMNL